MPVKLCIINVNYCFIYRTEMMLPSVSTHAFPYKKLQSDRHFRLFTLLPVPSSSQTDPEDQEQPLLRGMLSHTKLDDGPDFECLSYTWGARFVSRFISIHGYRVSIGENLADALYALRRHSCGRRLLWIDAICINQSDAAERGQQVSIMYDIFSQASRVNVYLGTGTARTERGLSSLCWYWVFEEDPWKLKRRKRLVTRSWLPNGLLIEAQIMWSGLRDIIVHPWFRRAWVVQEVMAAQVVDVYIGQRILPSSLLFGFFLLSRNHRHHLLPANPGEAETRAVELAMRQLFNFAQLSPTLLRPRSTIAYRRRPLVELLQEFRQCRASDPRDKVYALLKLSLDCDAPDLQPNYAHTVSELYTRVATYLLANGSAGRLLCAASYHASSLSVPSWVPDWSFQEDTRDIASAILSSAIVGGPSWLTTYLALLLEERSTNGN